MTPLQDYINELFTDVRNHLNNETPLNDKKEFGESLEEMVSLLLNDELESVRLLTDDRVSFEKLKFITYEILKHASNIETKQHAVKEAITINNIDFPLSFIIYIKKSLHSYQAKDFFKIETNIQNIQPLIEDLVSDLCYYSRKSDEDFSVDDARKFFSKKENVESFVEAFKKELISRNKAS